MLCIEQVLSFMLLARVPRLPVLQIIMKFVWNSTKWIAERLLPAKRKLTPQHFLYNRYCPTSPKSFCTCTLGTGRPPHPPRILVGHVWPRGCAQSRGQRWGLPLAQTRAWKGNKTYSFLERFVNGQIGGDKGTVSQNCKISKAGIAETQYRKFETNIPRKGIARGQSRIPHSCACERFIYSQDRSAYSAAGKYVDRFWEYINRSQTYECGNRD
jgi:hypothetical protein